jgi:hypothetical protein
VLRVQVLQVLQVLRVPKVRHRPLSTAREARRTSTLSTFPHP